MPGFGQVSKEGICWVGQVRIPRSIPAALHACLIRPLKLIASDPRTTIDTRHAVARALPRKRNAGLPCAPLVSHSPRRPGHA